jgi:hypothetical protein
MRREPENHELKEEDFVMELRELFGVVNYLVVLFRRASSGRELFLTAQVRLSVHI